ncbi:MAG: DUF11 domain-containing protein [Anaerolineae bacterium]|nr:DUF11 domain-containing protein [Anaerolineae bacterium]
MKKYGLMLIVLVSLLTVVFIGLDRFTPISADDAVDVRPLDIAVVFDTSGSMGYEATCFDCWEPAAKNDPKFDVIANPWPNNGYFNPLPDITTNNICSQAPQSIVHSTGKYVVHEAEHYSRDVPWQGWRFEQRQPGQGFWVIQRTDRNASGTDARGSYIRAHPFPVYSQSNVNDYPQLQGAAYNNECFSSDPSTNFMSGACWASKANILDEPVPPSTPPYVEYDFTPDWSGNTHVWIRAQGSGNYGWEWNGSSPGDNPSGYRNLPAWRKAIFWQVGKADGSDWELVSGRSYTNLDQSGDFRHPESDNWRWLKLGSVPTTSGVRHTLRLFQGSAGFQVDKIIFTDFDGGDRNTTIEENDLGTVRGNSFGITTAFKNFLKQDGWHGPAATPGSGTREACNVCNPVFGNDVTPAECSCKTSSSDSASSDYGAGGSGVGCTQVLTPTNNLENDLYHDEDPIRSAKEAVKNFAAQLDPKFDQMGLVAYSNEVYNGQTSTVVGNIKQRAELQCIQWAAKNTTQGVQKCYDPATNPISYTSLIRTVEIHNNTNGTNIPVGMREGLEELGVETPNNTNINSNCAPDTNDKSVCDRQGAAQRILILMTDGVPNDDDSDDAEGCPAAASGLWQGDFGQGRRAYDCSIYYAQQAAANDVALFTIGMGPGIYPDLLAAMSTGTDPTTDDVYFEHNCGAFFSVANLDALDDVFDQIETLARNCSQSVLDPQISSANGYILAQSDPLIAHLVDHQAIPYNIYLAAADGSTYPICLNVLPGGDDPACALDTVPPGGYELYSVVAGSQNPRVAVAPELVIVVADTGAPQILSLSGYANIQTTNPFKVHLENHPAAFSYDVYLKNASSAFKICSNITANALGRVTAPCSLTDVPPGLYDLVSVVAGTISPYLAVSEQQVEIIGDPAPALTIHKQGPATAAPDELITYTLTVTNSGSISATNVIITDTLPVGAHYVSGGTQIGNIIRWELASLEVDETVAQSFMVTATQTITNIDYSVTFDGGYQAIGMEPVVTLITGGSNPPPPKLYYLPTLFKEQ